MNTHKCPCCRSVWQATTLVISAVNLLVEEALSFEDAAITSPIVTFTPTKTMFRQPVRYPLHLGATNLVRIVRWDTFIQCNESSAYSAMGHVHTVQRI